MTFKHKEILYPTFVFFIFYFVMAIIVVMDRFSAGFFLINTSYILFAPGSILGIDVLSGIGLATQLAYLVTLSLISSFLVYVLIKIYCKKKNVHLTPKKLVLTSSFIVIFIISFFILVSLLGGIPNYISLDVRDSQTNESIKNLSMEFIEWKGNILRESPCRKPTFLPEGKLAAFRLFSLGFSSYFNDNRYYQDYVDHNFFSIATIYLTKKKNLLNLPGNYRENLFSTNSSMGCVNGSSVGFDFSRGITTDPENSDIILDSTFAIMSE